MKKFVVSLLLSALSISTLYAENRDTAKINGKDFADESALHNAVRAKSLETVKFLIEKNADINAKDQFGYTPLHLAVRFKDQDITKYLLEKGAIIDTSDNYGESPLLDAIRNNDTAIAKELICKKADRTILDDNDVSALHYASKNRNLDLVKLLTIDYVELYCQDKIEISIDKKEFEEDTKPKICGKVDIGYISSLDITLNSDTNKSFGPYSAKIDNEEHKWCTKVSDELSKGKYLITAKAKDYVVNEAEAKSEIYISSPIKIEFDDKNSNYSLTPKICGNIKNAYATKVDLTLSLQTKEKETSKPIGTFSAEIDNKNATWCTQINEELKEGIYDLKAVGKDNGNNSSTATSTVTLAPTMSINIDETPLYNDNTPQICGKILDGDVSKIEILLKSSQGVESNSFEAKIDKEKNTWCADVTDEMENGDYVIVASGYDEKEHKTMSESKTKIYLIMGLYEALNEEFKDDFSKWNAELDKDTLTFRFKDPTLLFNPGKSNINEKFEIILSDFFPRYVKTIEEYKAEIKRVRVEGHSSSEHARAKNDEERFELNRKLSQKRANAVMAYAKTISDDSVVNNIEWINSSFEPIGMSYSKLVYNLDGSEDKDLSRRVEFRIETKALEDVEVKPNEDVEKVIDEPQENTQELSTKEEPKETQMVDEAQENIDDSLSELELLEKQMTE